MCRGYSSQADALTGRLAAATLLLTTVYVARAQEATMPPDDPDSRTYQPENSDEAQALVAAVEEAGPEEDKGDAPWRHLRFDFSTMLSRRIEEGRGYRLDSLVVRTYAGSPWRQLTDLQLGVGRHFGFRVAIEKDPGERFGLPLVRRRPGTDFASASASLSDMGPAKTIVFGDFVAHWGWGLLVGRPAFHVQSRPPQPRTGGVKPYAGFNEVSFFRGIAVRITPFDRLEIELILSQRRMDGRPDTSSSAAFEIPGFVLAGGTGLHRTAGEIAVRGRVVRTTVGARARFEAGPLTAELGGLRLGFNSRILSGSRPDQTFRFAGSQQWGLSAHITLRTDRLRAASELAIVEGLPSGLVLSAALHGSPGWIAWVYYRWVGRAHQSLLGSIPRRSSGPLSSEAGVTFGVRRRIARGVTARVSFDQYRHDWLRFRLLTPTDGWTASLAMTARRSSSEARLSTTLRRQDHSWTGPAASGVILRATARATVWRTSIALRHDISRGLSVRLRYAGALSSVDEHRSEEGHVLGAGLGARPSRWLSLDTRLAIFSTESGAARVFMYESGLRHEFSIPSYSGQGERWHVLADLNPNRWTNVRLKFASTRWPGVAAVGSGNDEAFGERLRTVGAELRIRI